MALKNVKYQPGDILICKHGAMANTLGHSAMVIDKDHVINITGPGDTPHDVKISKFVNDSSDQWIKLYRPNNYNEGANAAQWLDDTYNDSRVPYSLFVDIRSTNKTYCTHMIFQAYYFANKCSQNISAMGIIPPFSLVDILEMYGFSMAYMGKIVD